MFNFMLFKPKRIEKDILDIETILQSSLKPVSPRPEFIQSLHKGLMEYTFDQPDSSEFDLKKTVIIALAGLISMVFIFSLWIRLIVVIISTLGMVQTSKRKRGNNSTKLQQTS
jgi:t-SNARE complex subunit (syntaxin)